MRAFTRPPAAGPEPKAFRPEDLDEARRLLNALLAQSREGFAPSDYLPVSEDDPGRILLLLLIASAIRITADAAEASRRAAIDSIFREAIGPPRPARPARVPVALAGPAGTIIGPDAQAASRDGSRSAMLARGRALVLFEIRAIDGLAEEGGGIPLPVTPSDGPDRERTPSPFAALRGLRVDLSWGRPSPLPSGVVPASLAWDTSPALSRRICGATQIYDGAPPLPTRVLFETGGRAVVRLRAVAGLLPSRVELTFGRAIAPEEQRYIGRLVPSVAIGRETRSSSDRPELASLSPRRRGLGLASDPRFDGWPARGAETAAAWRKRALHTLRPGGPAGSREGLLALLTREHPEARILDVAPCRVERRDGVRVAILPARFDGPLDALDRAVTLAPRLRRTLERNLPEGVAVRVGPPFFEVGRAALSDDDPIRLHLDRLVEPDQDAARDDEGIAWPVFHGGPDS